MISGTKGARWEGVNENGGRPLCLRAGQKERRHEGKGIEYRSQAPKIGQGVAGAKADELARMNALREAARRHTDIFLSDSTKDVDQQKASRNRKQP
ncbi:hypothetical protein [Rhizobium azibense]|uniref:Uncharacterized protein n=1 Tax=Rhizobium azibense TaxID=1136135 RepID=A0A4R3RPS4_9HYPH|nr:hypothetical protein [Rhizobium azibense]TCU37943.1 hypothetical protein EV129_105261 [Rhizobium azibense]